MIRTLVIFILAFQLSLAHADPDCPEKQPPAASKVTQSAAEMSSALCKAADDGRLLPPSETLFANCGFGAQDGFNAFLAGLKSTGVAIKDIAVGSYDFAASKIQSLWSSTDDAAKAAELSAKENTAAANSWLDSAGELYEASKILIAEYFKEVDHSFRLVGGSMMCLPAKFQLAYACQAVSHLILELGTLKAVATAADKSFAAAKAIKEFMARTGQIDELKKLSLADRLKAGASALELQAEAKVVEKLGASGTLKSRLDPISKKEMLYFEESAIVDGKRITSLREIPKDAKTLAIDANFETGARVARLTSEQAVGEHLLFFDVNNLGKVNYFKAGTQAGDEYLSRVGENIRKNLRPEDRLFKNGGDELVAIVRVQDPKKAKEVISRIHKSIEKDEKLQKLFHTQRAAVAKDIKSANQGHVKSPSKEQVESLQESARVRPSVSVGSTKIKGNWANDLAAAEKQAGDVKSAYKMEIGSDASKYGRSGAETKSRPNLKAKPRVLDPVN